MAFFHIFLLDRAKPGLIAVNSEGQRFVNEACSYHDFVEAMYRSHEVINTMPAWLICDSTFVLKYGIGTIHPGTKKLRKHAEVGYATISNTISDLATLLGINENKLGNTVRRNNEFAATGIDADFGKGDLELNRFNGDADNQPNPCLGYIEEPPFVAVAVWPAEIGCSIGFKTNINGQVLNQEDKEIVGMYACGNDMSSIMAGVILDQGLHLVPQLYLVIALLCTRLDGLPLNREFQKMLTVF